VDHGKKVAYATGGLGVAAGASILTLGVLDTCVADEIGCNLGRDALIVSGALLVTAGVLTLVEAIDGPLVK